MPRRRPIKLRELTGMFEGLESRWKSLMFRQNMGTSNNTQYNSNKEDEVKLLGMKSKSNYIQTRRDVIFTGKIFIAGSEFFSINITGITIYETKI